MGRHDPVEWFVEWALIVLERRGLIELVQSPTCKRCRFHLRDDRCWYIGYWCSAIGDPCPKSEAVKRADDMRADPKLCGPQAL